MAGLSGLLGGLMGGFNDLTAAQGGIGGLAQTASGTWSRQSTLTKGAIAGGLLGVLLSGNARRLVGTGVEVGGAALIGSLAMQAFSNWQAGKAAAAANQPVNLPSPGGAFLPSDPAAQEDLSHRLLQAMIAATKADGVVTDVERAAIEGQLGKLGLGPEAEGMIRAQLDAPLDMGQVAALARNPQEAAGIYTASLLVVNRDGAAEKGYLAMLAARLGLDAGLVAHLEAGAAQLT